MASKNDLRTAIANIDNLSSYKFAKDKFARHYGEFVTPNGAFIILVENSSTFDIGGSKFKDIESACSYINSKNKPKKKLAKKAILEDSESSEDAGRELQD